MKQSQIISGFSILCALIIASIFTGCGGFGFAYEKQLSGKYGLVACDVLEQMDVCDVSELQTNNCATEVIPSTVFAVGWDEHFIIAKQHPCNNIHQLNKSVTNFYILRVSDGALTGPMDESAFDVERTKLDVSTNLSFTLVFDSLK